MMFKVLARYHGQHEPDEIDWNIDYAEAKRVKAESELAFRGTGVHVWIEKERNEDAEERTELLD